jgi:hypothetical protein
MSWADDTNDILEESGSVAVTVRSASFSHTNVIPSQTTTVVETSTVYIFSKSGKLIKDERGQIIDRFDLIIFPQTSSVAVKHRLFESGSTDYHEVESVCDYLGHKEIHARKVEGR